ncbi:acetyl-CoA C-acetyltransferase [Sphingomonas baiyangensis]|uniref:Acetyl-CoA C-acyltransferase n=1 Tax=Sphingomonas baiyangensis TaxID=2572576 RepID=A0A4V5PUI8_9SPHN|nr:acetyl-CoA C-acetyltransferase [Sphingomonas baiyangensis]TKD50418.1 acetyl-CoA C-acyltransferase [Sphingomonas baiyangensis]
MAEAYIVEAARTPGGRRKGGLASVHPADLGAVVLNALVERSGVDPAAIDDVIVGCVSQVGEQAFAFGRNMVLASKLPQTVPAVTIDRQCGSSQQALHFAAQAVMSGTQDLVIAAGAEHMTRVPMGSNVHLAQAAGLGEGPFSRAILDRFGVKGFSQFHGAQAISDKYGFSRAEMDAFALESHRKARAAIESGAFAAEIVPVETADGVVSQDEGVRFDASIEAIGGVRTIAEGGSITAANASQITDGASGVLIASETAIKRFGLKPLARIVNLTVTAGDPVIMLEEPIPATARALERSGLKIDDIDLFEVNEAFASVPMAWLKATGADAAKLNVNGGAIALGHPLGGTGTKLMTTLVHALRARGGRYGLQTMCEGGGIANVTIVEAV